MSKTNTIKGMMLTMAVAVALLGCGGDVHMDGLFSVSAMPVTLVDESQGLQFFARTTKDVEIFKVVVTNPQGIVMTLEGNDLLLYEGEVLQLQQEDEAYNWTAGQWSFRFVGNIARGNRESFDTTELFGVGL
jgi:hypothetical protein